MVTRATKIILENAPHLKDYVIEIIEYVFVPRAIARQVALAILLETGVVTVNQVLAIVKKLYSNFSSRSRLITQLEREQKKAETQDEWMDLAEQIDNIQGNDLWRTEPTCPLYESDRISSRIDEFVHLMRRRDCFDLMFTLRGGIARNTFGLLHEGLFSKALAGTKVLVETYHNIVCTSLEFVCDALPLPGDEIIPTEAKLAFFNETRHMYGRTALMVSGGAALGFYHAGVVKALMKNGLLPRVLSGASAGSIVTAMIATRTDEECQRDLFNVQGTDAPGHSGKLMVNFFRPMTKPKISHRTHHHNKENALLEVLHNNAGAFADGKKTWQLLFPIGIRKFSSALYDIITGHKRAQDVLMSDTEHFRTCCKANIGNFTFQEAFDRTGRILNIIVSPQNRSDPPRLLNYLTAPHVLVWSAAVASSSLPGVFEPNKLLVKDADGTERSESATVASFIDGSMEQDLPMQQLSEMFNINHFIISQANPHAVLLASFGVNKSVWTNKFMGLVTGVLLFLKRQAKAWLENLVESIGGQRIAPMWDTRRGFLKQFFTQEYEGRDIDISLIPWKSHRSLLSAMLHCIYNPSNDEFLEWVEAAERETWKYIPKIKSHVAVEMTLDTCVQKLRLRLIAENRASERASNKIENMQQTMSNRLPSFFTSASLVNMSGLGITDRHNLSQEEVAKLGPHNIDRLEGNEGGDLPIRKGWNGMGLRGNFSSGSLNRCASGGSGLFLMDGEADEESAMQQQAREFPKRVNGGEASYLKTTSMSNFYYGRKSNGNLTDALGGAEFPVVEEFTCSSTV